jgi:hypothetical protein
MLGAAEAGREALAIELDPTEQTDWTATITRLGSALEPAARLRAWNEGRLLGVWEAIDSGIRTRLRAVAA